MTHGAHTARHRGGPEPSDGGRRKAAVLLAAVGVLAVLAGTVAWAITLLPDTTDASANTPRGEEPTVKSASSPNKTADGEPIPKALVACKKALSLGERVIKAAEPGVGHWEEHLRAHTELVEGKIEYSDVESIFERTSGAGPGDLERFDAVDAEYEKVAEECDAITDDGVPDDWKLVAEACVFYDGATRSVVEESREAMDDWRAHLADEKAHREGELTGDEAEAKWLDAWRNGSPKIAAFDAALEQRDSTPKCNTATAS